MTMATGLTYSLHTMARRVVVLPTNWGPKGLRGKRIGMSRDRKRHMAPFILFNLEIPRRNGGERTVLNITRLTKTRHPSHDRRSKL